MCPFFFFFPKWRTITADYIGRDSAHFLVSDLSLVVQRKHSTTESWQGVAIHQVQLSFPLTVYKHLQFMAYIAQI